MAFAGEPKLLLMDEPIAGMGPRIPAHGRPLPQAQGGVTILLIEHDMETVFAVADRITVLVYGRSSRRGAPRGMRTDDAVREAYLGEQEASGSGCSAVDR